MLYKIENCHPKKYLTDTSRLLALSNLLKTNGERKNIVIADKITLNDILESKIYGALDKIYAQDILSNEREIGNLPKSLEIHTIVNFELESEDISYNKVNKSIVIGYKFFTDPEKISSPHFITENESDYKLYNYIAIIYQKHITKHKLGVNFNFCLGAGSTCKRQFTRLKKEKRMVLCIVDSDKTHPQKAEGSTSAAFRENERGLNESAFVEVLDQREIESLIPINIIERVVTEKIKEKIDALDTIKSMKEINNDSLRYFDLKEGMNIQEMIDLDNNHGKFWTDILSRTTKFNAMTCVKKKQKDTCKNCSSCPEISGISSNLLNLTLDAIETENTHCVFKNLEPQLLSEWTKLGNLISSWGCHLSSAPSRA